MKKQQLIDKVVKPVLIPVYMIYATSLLCVLASPFIWIWVDATLAWKVWLSGFFAFIIALLIFRFVKHVATEAVENDLKKEEQSTFQEKLNKMVEQNKTNNNNEKIQTPKD